MSVLRKRKRKKEIRDCACVLYSASWPTSSLRAKSARLMDQSGLLLGLRPNSSFSSYFSVLLLPVTDTPVPLVGPDLPLSDVWVSAIIG